MQEGVTLVFAGGDRRMVTAARSFAAEGATVLMTGFDRYGQSAPGLQFVHQLQRAIPRADGLILPLPYTQGGGILNAPFSEKQILLDTVFRLADKAKVICGGMLPEEDERYFDYYDEPMMLRNADVTAEAALLMAGEKMAGCLGGSSLLVVGYGRIGKRLAAKARALGCNVTVAARKESDHALIRVCGHHAIGFEKLEEAVATADAVCNTVPAEVFSEKVMEKLPREVPLIDLAGSITGSRVIRAPGLPGKYAPETAGMILAESLKRILKREGLL
jgi:dipicolinate synthase subunit A